MLQHHRAMMTMMMMDMLMYARNGRAVCVGLSQ
jgi:hypothetical protein